MRKSEAIAFYSGNISALARALGIDQSSIYSWKGESIPGGRQLQLERITGGLLKADPDCMEGKPKKAAWDGVDRRKTARTPSPTEPTTI